MTVKVERENFNSQSQQSFITDYWDALSPEILTDTQQVIKKLRDQGKIFLQMGDCFEKNLSDMHDWSEILDKTFARMHGGFAHPFDLTQTSPKPDHEESNTLLIHAIIKYQQSLLAYNQFFSHFNQLSLTRMKQKLNSWLVSNKTIDSLRDLYHLWIDSCEEIYSERVKTSEYAILYGDLINSFVKVKQLSKMGESAIEKIRKLENELEKSHQDVKNLAKEITILKQQMSEIKSSQQ